MVSREFARDFGSADQHDLWAIMGATEMWKTGEAARFGITLTPVDAQTDMYGNTELIIAISIENGDLLRKQDLFSRLVRLIHTGLKQPNWICPDIKFCSERLAGELIVPMPSNVAKRIDQSMCVRLPQMSQADAFASVRMNKQDAKKVSDALRDTIPLYDAMPTMSCREVPKPPPQKPAWESAKVQDDETTYKAVMARAKAASEAARGKRKVRARAQRVAQSVEGYLQTARDQYYRPRFPSEWRPVVPRTSDNCKVLRDLAVKAGCAIGPMRNPAEEIDTTFDVDGFRMHKAVIVGIGGKLITSHDDRDERMDNPFTAHGYKAGGKLKNVNDKLIHELLDSPPVVWSENGHAPYYVLSGNKNIISFRRSGDWLKKSEYFDAVHSIPFKDGHQRGFLVLVLEGDPVEYLNYLGYPVPVNNPMLMVPQKNPVLMVGNPRGSGHYKPGVNGPARGQVPVDELPDGAVPLDQVPQSVKNDPSFQKSMEMFKKRYGGYPDYAIQAQVPSGMPQVLCGIGQIKQLDYWAADNVKEAGNWTHWFHEAGERGEGKSWTRAGLLAADPHTGRPVMGEQKGVDMKFTPRGIVG